MTLFEDRTRAADAITSIPSPFDRLAAWSMRGPLTVLIAIWIVAMLALWVPHYLTWPIWIDIDQFATMSMGWARGTQLPYRDIFTYNFPGQIYLFWIVGELAGWGNTSGLYAFDASLLVVLGLAMAIWSRARFGRALPGLIGYLAFVSFYLGLGYHLVLQRDWHCGFFAVMGLMALQVWPRRSGRAAAAVGMAAALLIRPQAVLYLPAFVLALDAEVRKGEKSLRNTMLMAFWWGLSVASLVAIGFVPLFADGIFGDFLHAFRQTIGNGPYTVRPCGSGGAQEKLTKFLGLTPIWSVLIVTIASSFTLDFRQRRAAWAWVAALGCVCLYIPLTPIPQSYHSIPIVLIWSFNLALLAGSLLEMRSFPPALRLGAIGLVVLIGRPWMPEFCEVDAVRSVASSKKAIPPGYRPRDDNIDAAYYDWSDYTTTLEYLRRSTGPGTHVANALLFLPAITYPTARTATFPAESLQLLTSFDRPEDWRTYAAALARAPTDSVVVWDQSDELSLHFPTFRLVAAIIRRDYQPEAKFGVIEVWRHKAGVR